MDNTDVIITRIKKLLALASRNSSIEEAASAMAEAQRLMSKHQIEMATVEGEEGITSTIVAEAIEEDHGRAVRWRAVLAMSVAEANFCRSIWVEHAHSKHGALTFFGTKANVTMAKDLFELVVAQIERLTKEAVRRATREKAINAKSYGESFRLGVVSIVRNRLVALTKERDVNVAVGASSTALVILGRNDAAIEHFLASFGKMQDSKKGRADIAPDAFFDGMKAGKGIHLGKQLGKG